MVEARVSARERESLAHGRTRQWKRIALCTLALLQTALARAEQQAPATLLDTPVLVVDSAGVDDLELPAALRELCARVGIRVAAPFEAVVGDVLLLAHIRADGDEIELSVEDAHTRKLVGERSVQRAGSQALARETLAHVLLGLVEPWIERVRKARTSPPPPPPQPVLGAEPLAPAPLVVTLGLAGGAMALARDQWGGRFTGNTALVWSSRLEPTLALDLHGAPPVNVSERDVRARFWMLGARLRGRLDLFRGKRGACDAALSGGIDLLALKPTSARDGVALSALSVRPQPVFGAALGGRVQLSPRIQLVIALGADVDPMPRAWQVNIDGDRSTLLRSTWLRPYALFGLDFVARPAPQLTAVAP
jgi:hypothetical protein